MKSFKNIFFFFDPYHVELIQRAVELSLIALKPTYMVLNSTS